MVGDPDLLQALLPIRPGLAGSTDQEPPPEWAAAEKPSPPERLDDVPARDELDPLRLLRDSNPSPWEDAVTRLNPARPAWSDDPA